MLATSERKKNLRIVWTREWAYYYHVLRLDHSSIKVKEREWRNDRLTERGSKEIKKLAVSSKSLMGKDKTIEAGRRTSSFDKDLSVSGIESKHELRTCLDWSLLAP